MFKEINKFPVQPFLLMLLMVVIFSDSGAAVIQRSIAIDGNFSDWKSPDDITVNPGQFSEDGQDSCPGSTDNDAYDNGDPGTGNCVGLSGGTGRDLKKFAFTYDATHLYLYVERFANASNTTDWWFYIDVDNDGLMESTDVLYRVSWKGANRSTDRELWNYTPANTGGDPLAGGILNEADGYTMPGTISNRQSLSSPTGGSSSGLEMETRLPWSTLCGSGCGPVSVGFHIASSNGTNLPNNIADNMDGPGGGGGSITILDLGVDKAASVSEASGGDADFDYTITLTNNGGGDASGVTLTDVLPPGVTYVSHTASLGTYNAGSGLWDIGGLVDGVTATLNITVSPDPVTSEIVVINTVDNLTLNEADTDSSNNSDSVDVTITPPPLLSVTKVSNRTSASPKEIIAYKITVQNMGTGPAYNVLVTDNPSDYTALNINAHGAGQPFLFTDGSPASGLAPGTPEYSDNGGADYLYSLTSGSGNASAGFDGQLTNWRIPMTGAMDPGTSFTIDYQMEVK